MPSRFERRHWWGRWLSRWKQLLVSARKAESNTFEPLSSVMAIAYVAGGKRVTWVFRKEWIEYAAVWAILKGG